MDNHQSIINLPFTVEKTRLKKELNQYLEKWMDRSEFIPLGPFELKLTRSRILKLKASGYTIRLDLKVGASGIRFLKILESKKSADFLICGQIITSPGSEGQLQISVRIDSIRYDENKRISGLFGKFLYGLFLQMMRLSSRKMENLLANSLRQFTSQESIKQLSYYQEDISVSGHRFLLTCHIRPDYFASQGITAEDGIWNSKFKLICAPEIRITDQKAEPVSISGDEINWSELTFAGENSLIKPKIFIDYKFLEHYINLRIRDIHSYGLGTVQIRLIKPLPEKGLIECTLKASGFLSARITFRFSVRSPGEDEMIRIMIERIEFPFDRMIPEKFRDWIRKRVNSVFEDKLIVTGNQLKDWSQQMIDRQLPAWQENIGMILNVTIGEAGIEECLVKSEYLMLVISMQGKIAAKVTGKS